jgi:inner membrane protein
MLGSILPDIIDKPIGMFLFGNGRVFTHSLLAAVLLLLIGSYLYLNRKQTGVIAIGIGTFTHLIFDQMWQTPRILLWPTLGWRFPIGVRINYIHRWIATLFHNPYVYISETIGFINVFGFFRMLLREHKLKSFILKGQLTP